MSDLTIATIAGLGAFCIALFANTEIKSTRVRTITFNMGKNKLTLLEWVNVFKNWDIITNSHEYDILFISFQEAWNIDSKYGKMGEAINTLLNPKFDFYSHAEDGQKTLLFYSTPPFSVHNYVFVRKLGVPHSVKFNKHQVCHQSKLSICTKATVAISLILNQKHFVFLSSHLPFKSQKEDFGYADRVIAMKEAIKMLNNIGKNVTVFWAGDMNFRRDTLADNVVHDDQLNYLKHSDLLNEFKESSINFPATCKLYESSICRKKSGKINFVTKECYHTETDSGKRIPSHCDRILVSKNVKINNYYSWTDGNVIVNSDHSVVVADCEC